MIDYRNRTSSKLKLVISHCTITPGQELAHKGSYRSSWTDHTNTNRDPSCNNKNKSDAVNVLKYSTQNIRRQNQSQSQLLGTEDGGVEYGAVLHTQRKDQVVGHRATRVSHQGQFSLQLCTTIAFTVRCRPSRTETEQRRHLNRQSNVQQIDSKACQIEQLWKRLLAPGKVQQGLSLLSGGASSLLNWGGGGGSFFGCRSGGRSLHRGLKP